VLVRQHRTFDELAPYREAWDRLAGDGAFRSWTWLRTWWRHFGHDGDATLDAERRRGRQLCVLLAFDGAAPDSPRPANLAGVLPCYVVRSLTHGAELRLLGDGIVCSDHLGVLAARGKSIEVAEALATHLAETPFWDLADFANIDEDDRPTEALFHALCECDCAVAEYASDRCWTIDLPGDWEDFLARQSKSHRKQLRQAERRVLGDGRAIWRPADNAADFDAAWNVLIELHQRRRQSLGEPGCFATPSWAAFHRDVAAQLLAAGRLRLSWLELDGAPAAAEYHVAGTHTTFAYQGGVDPDRLAEEPGRLSTIRCIQRAIAEGHTHFDFLRGDEPYKPHWRATPRPTWRRQAAAPRRWAKLRRQTWDRARRVSQLARQLTGMFS
jgi:hypothetical protein